MIDKDKLPVRTYWRKKKAYQVKEKPEVIDGLCALDVGELLERFRGDEETAVSFVAERTGADMDFARVFVGKMFRTLGLCYDEAVPGACSDAFWESVRDKTHSAGLRESGLLRYAELRIKVPGSIRLITRVKLAPRRRMRIYKSPEVEEKWEYEYRKGQYPHGILFGLRCQDGYGGCKGTDSDALFVLTDESAFWAAENGAEAGIRCYSGWMVPISSIEDILLCEKKNALGVSILTKPGSGGIDMELSGGWELMKQTVVLLLDGLGLKRDDFLDEYLERADPEWEEGLADVAYGDLQKAGGSGSADEQKRREAWIPRKIMEAVMGDSWDEELERKGVFLSEEGREEVAEALARNPSLLERLEDYHERMFWGFSEGRNDQDAHIDLRKLRMLIRHLSSLT